MQLLETQPLLLDVHTGITFTELVPDIGNFFHW
jgi:hypothetical protein